jgi:hypothetical protein
VTQTNGLDVLLAWCGFAVLIGVLAYVLLRNHANPGAETRKTAQPPASAPTTPVPKERSGGQSGGVV